MHQLPESPGDGGKGEEDGGDSVFNPRTRVIIFVSPGTPTIAVNTMSNETSTLFVSV
jgi:hypothetical protein